MFSAFRKILVNLIVGVTSVVCFLYYLFSPKEPKKTLGDVGYITTRLEEIPDEIRYVAQDIISSGKFNFEYLGLYKQLQVWCHTHEENIGNISNCEIFIINGKKAIRYSGKDADEIFFETPL